jgi:drug/metabolite transporter (DMT)-like permease
MKKHHLGSLLVLLSAFGFGALAIFALYAYRGGINVTSLLFIRFGLASLFFFAYLLKGRFGIKVKTKQLGLLATLGLFYVTASICYLSALRYIPASLNAFIYYIYPAFVCFLSFVSNREALSLKIGLSLGLAMFGLMLILGTSFQSVNLIGSLLSLGAAVMYSFYIIICQRLLKRLSPRMMSAYVTFFAALSLLLLQWVLGQKIRFDFAPMAWVFLLGIVLFSTVAPILLFMRGLQFVGPSRTAILSMTEPLFTVVLSVILFRDRLALSQLAGGFLVLLGAFIIVAQSQTKAQGASG